MARFQCNVKHEGLALEQEVPRQTPQQCAIPSENIQHVLVGWPLVKKGFWLLMVKRLAGAGAAASGTSNSGDDDSTTVSGADLADISKCHTTQPLCDFSLQFNEPASLSRHWRRLWPQDCCLTIRFLIEMHQIPSR